MNTEKNIESLYELFNDYKLFGKIDKCPCGCISKEEEQKIYSKPLKELEADDIGFYCGKAMTTWGDEENYKHFIPRIIEIYKKDKANGWIDLDTIYNKLEYANWETWSIKEQEEINRFVEIDWSELVNKTENEVWLIDFQSYLSYFSFEELFSLWKFPENNVALKNFIVFFYMNGNEIINNKKDDKSKLLLAVLNNRENLR